MAEDYKFPKATDIEKLSAKSLRALFPDGMVDTFRWKVEKKYDGCAAIVRMVNVGGEWSATMESSGGHKVTSCDHILAELERLAGTLETSAVLVGEVWSPHMSFQEISGQFRREAPSPDLEFRVFDGYTEGPWESRPDARTRLLEVRDFILCGGDSVYPATPPFKTSGGLTPLGLIQELAQEFVKEGPGYDGIILRDLDAPFIEGRTTSVIKIKPTLEYTCEIIGYKIERGEKTGREVLSLNVKTSTFECWVGSGVSHDIEPEDLIRAKFCDIECMGLFSSGVPREPRFKGFRYDKSQSD